MEINTKASGKTASNMGKARISLPQGILIQASSKKGNQMDKAPMNGLTDLYMSVLLRKDSNTDSVSGAKIKTIPSLINTKESTGKIKRTAREFLNGNPAIFTVESTKMISGMEKER